MAYEVLALKWRPQQFDDVVGQQHVTETLKNAIKGDRIAHAYVFVGPRGIGKTSIARIFAKALNCAEGASAEPCDKCDSCKEIAEGRNLDVLEIDGASNNSVDQIRELRETVKFLPTRGKFKIYIIDEVHMLSPQAFNALLKTLEEPPPHVKFVFATTEPQKILATILSRCQRFDLRRIPADLIVGRLATIAKDEGVTIEPDALLAVARGSEGGLRDAESALDQLISFKGKKIAEDDVLSVFGLIARQTLHDLVDAILDGEIPRLLAMVAEVDNAGKDMQRLVLDLLGHFRNLLVFMCAGKDTASLDVAESELPGLQQQATRADTERILRITDILMDAERQLRYALSKRTLLETSLIRCARAATTVSIDDILGELNILKGQGGAVTPRADSTPAPAASPVAEASAVAPKIAPAAEVSRDSTDDVTSLRQRWHEIVDVIGKSAALARTALLDATPLSVDGADVVIGFDPEFAEHMESMKSRRNVNATNHVLTAELGRKVKVAFSMIPEGGVAKLPADKKPRHAPDKKVADDTKTPAKKSGNGKKKSIADWAKDDAVRKTLDAFGGEIIDIRE